MFRSVYRAPVTAVRNLAFIFCAGDLLPLSLVASKADRFLVKMEGIVYFMEGEGTLTASCFRPATEPLMQMPEDLWEWRRRLRNFQTALETCRDAAAGQLPEARKNASDAIDTFHRDLNLLLGDVSLPVFHQAARLIRDATAKENGQPVDSPDMEKNIFKVRRRPRRSDVQDFYTDAQAHSILADIIARRQRQRELEMRYQNLRTAAKGLRQMVRQMQWLRMDAWLWHVLDRTKTSRKFREQLGIREPQLISSVDCLWIPVREPEAAKGSV